MRLIIVALLVANFVGVASFVLNLKHFLGKTRNSKLSISIPGIETPKEDAAKREYHLFLLDCLTSDLDDDSMENIRKLDTRARLIKHTEMTDLCAEMESKGLPASADKIEMLIRLLNYELDPYSALKYKRPGAVLEYASDQLIAEGQIRRLTEEELLAIKRRGPDAPDLAALRTNNFALHKGPPVITDGNIRKEITLEPSNIRRYGITTSDSEPINCYAVAPRRGGLRWIKESFPVVVLLPDHSGWESEGMRMLADRIASSNKAIVLLPDIYRGQVVSHHSNVLEVMQWTKRLDGEQIVDDILSTLKYVGEQYPERSVSLIGVGYGGGKALEVSCDLYSIACWSEAQELWQIPGIAQDIWTPEVIQNVMHIHDKYGLFRKTKAGPNMYKPNPAYSNRKDYGEGEVMTRDTIKRDAEKAAQALIKVMQRERDKEMEEERERQRREINGEPEPEGQEEEDDEDEGEIDYSEDDLFGDIVDGRVAGTQKRQQADNSGGEGKEGEEGNHPVSIEFNPYQVAEMEKSIADPNYNVTGVVLNGSAIAQAFSAGTADQSNHTDTKEKETSVSALDEKLLMLRQQVNVVFNRSLHLESRLKFDTSKPGMTAFRFAALAPQAVCAIQACHFNASKVAHGMLGPARIIWWLNDTSPDAGEHAMEIVYTGFFSRLDEILDFSMTVFGEGNSTSFTNPVDDIDKISRWICIRDVCIWLETFKSRTGENFCMAAGAYKRRSADSLKTYRRVDVEKMSGVIKKEPNENPLFKVTRPVEKKADRQKPLGID